MSNAITNPAAVLHSRVRFAAPPAAHVPTGTPIEGTVIRVAGSSLHSITGIALTVDAAGNTYTLYWRARGGNTFEWAHTWGSVQS